MKKFLILILIASCAQLPINRRSVLSELKKPLSQQVSPFISDGCSFWPEGTKTNKTKWIKCCIVHDLKYWAGGTKVQRNNADSELEACVEKVQGSIVAELMKEGTQIGGSPKFKTAFRWGYGWNYTRGYLALTKNEKTYLKTISPKKGENLIRYLDKSKIDPEIEKLEDQIY